MTRKQDIVQEVGVLGGGSRGGRKGCIFSIIILVGGGRRWRRVSNDKNGCSVRRWVAWCVGSVWVGDW